MERNMFRRVEIAFPIEDSRLAERVLKEGLSVYLSDNTQSWILQSDGSYKRFKPGGNQKIRSAQQTLLEKWTD
jgi:polyphosphate kinase